jgi:hypothetical protein
MKCERCQGILSMSATSGGTTWWRCTGCGNMQGIPATPPPPPAPRIAPTANPARYASGAELAYGGNATLSSVSRAEAPLPHLSDGAAPQGNGPAPPTAIESAPIPAASNGASEGCGVCGSDDVQYVLETDVGVDAATLAKGHVVRAAFCSIDCLAEKLGLVPPRDNPI